MFDKLMGLFSPAKHKQDTDLLSVKQREQISDWIAKNGEVWVNFQLPRSVLENDSYFVKSLDDLDQLIARNSESEFQILIFGDLQFPIRGLAGDALYARACEAIPDGEWYQVVSPRQHFPDKYSVYGSGTSHLSLRETLDRMSGEAVAIGGDPLDLDTDLIYSNPDNVIVLKKLLDFPANPANGFGPIKTVMWPEGWTVSSDKIETYRAYLSLSPPGHEGMCPLNLTFKLFFDEQPAPELTKTYLEILSRPDHVLSSSELEVIGEKSNDDYTVTSVYTRSVSGKRALVSEGLYKDWYRGMQVSDMAVVVFEPDGRQILGIEYLAETGCFVKDYHTARRVISSIEWKA